MGVEYNVPKKGGIILNYDNSETRRFVEHCYRTTSTMVNPIIDWTESEVWEFLHYYGCESNPLYQLGNRRVGCIGCPFANQSRRIAEFKKYPTYKIAYIRAFEKMLKNKSFDNDWKTGEDVFYWWLRLDKNQLTFERVEDK